jgi:hypothetical protein
VGDRVAGWTSHHSTKTPLRTAIEAGLSHQTHIRGQFTYIVVPNRKQDSETRPTTLVSHILQDCGPFGPGEVDISKLYPLSTTRPQCLGCAKKSLTELLGYPFGELFGSDFLCIIVFGVLVVQITLTVDARQIEKIVIFQGGCNNGGMWIIF